MKTISWIFFGFFAVSIGLYPLVYALVDMHGGLLGTKSDQLLANRIWTTTFYLHISLGGIALLTGWTQFSKKIRNRYLQLHRRLGKIYVIAVSVSGLAAFHIAFYATGGLVTQLGFTGLAIAWLFTTTRAFQSIVKLQIEEHRQWMIRSYALTFAAVTLRLWLPLFQFALGMDFFSAYKIISWLCWVPNLIVAEVIIASMRNKISRFVA